MSAEGFGTSRADMAERDGPRDHRGLLVLTLDECMEHLRSTPIGRIAFVHEGDPVILPVSHAVDGMDVVFRSTWGSKLDHARDSGPVAFEVDGIDADRGTGWSVLVSGVLVVVYDAAETARLDSLGLRGWAEVVEPSFWVRVRAEQVTGRATERPSS
jgi:nitroimidazol reductase NimA-like FMN-containing flavoprotein (pyridoxamine 5'-phosphate oxidase superfamily)